MCSFGKTAFKEWLESKALKGQKAGTSQEPTKCPIATFYRESLGAQRVSVNPDEIIYVDADGREHGRGVPRWARIFINRVDSGWRARRISAKDALEALKGL
jgi:hypothetical protein